MRQTRCFLPVMGPWERWAAAGAVLVATVVLYGCKGGGSSTERAHSMQDAGAPPQHTAATRGGGDEASGQGRAGDEGRGRGERGQSSWYAPWPFAAVSMRVHPLTHVVRDEKSGAWIIEARVEFFDQFGNTTKSVGKGQWVLRPLHDSSLSLDTWQVDLSNLDANKLHYDDVTRTYLYRLEIKSGEDLPEVGRLTLTIETAGGKVLHADFEVGLP